MTTDLEQLVRDTLAGRADTVSSGPSWPPADGLPSDEVLDLVPIAAADRRSRPRWLLAAAAAVVLAAAIGIGVAVVGRHDPSRPVSTGPTPAPPTITRTACRATVPPSWTQAIRQASVGLGSLSGVQVVATTADGSAVVQYDTGPGLTDSVGVVRAGSSTVTHLATIATTTRGLGLDITAAGRTALVRVEEGINRTDRYTRIIAVDIDSGRQRVIADAAGRPRQWLTGRAFLQDGSVYWSTIDGRGQRMDHIHRTELSTGRSTVVARGVFDLEQSAAGIRWSLTSSPTDRPASLPPAVASHVTEDTFDSFVTDGRSYAWQTESGAIEWWQPGAASVVRVPGRLARIGSSSEPGTVWTVAGRYVVYSPPRTDEQRILDMRTGGEVDEPIALTLLGRNDVLVGNPLRPLARTDRLMRLNTAGLPDLRC